MVNNRWFKHWMSHSFLLADMSVCPRGKVGAFIIDASNNPISAGFNGPPRKAPGLYCAGDHCKRDHDKIESGTSVEVGCHHAEMNAIANSAKKGISLKECTMIVSTNPCLSCAKMIHHAGLAAVVVPATSYYPKIGLEYLITNNIEVISI